jgi:FimV-like protein
LAAAIAGWFMSRRQPAGVLLPTLDRSKDETVRGIKDEAEEILKVLEPEGAAEEEPSAAAGSPLDIEAGAAGWRRSRPAVGRGPDEAEVLDEESEDPEVQLDLARAYIAMGDREAARVILDEVIQQGNETQQAEARSMLGEL